MSYCPSILELTVLSRICRQPTKFLRLRGVGRHLQLRVPTLDIHHLLDVFCLGELARQRKAGVCLKLLCSGAIGGGTSSYRRVSPKTFFLEASDALCLEAAQKWRNSAEYKKERLSVTGGACRTSNFSARADKVRQVLIPAQIAARLLASRGDAPASAPVFGSVRRPGEVPHGKSGQLHVKAAAERAGVNPAVSVHRLRHTHANRRPSPSCRPPSAMPI